MVSGKEGKRAPDTLRNCDNQTNYRTPCMFETFWLPYHQSQYFRSLVYIYTEKEAIKNVSVFVRNREGGQGRDQNPKSD